MAAAPINPSFQFELVNGRDGPQWRDAKGHVSSGQPPVMDLIWHNLQDPYAKDGAFGVIFDAKKIPLDVLLVSIGDDIREGLYALQSVQASQYHAQIVVYSRLSTDALLRARWERFKARKYDGIGGFAVPEWEITGVKKEKTDGDTTAAAASKGTATVGPAAASSSAATT